MQFEGSFENTQWREVKQMHTMWLCIFSTIQFKGTFENTHWRKKRTSAANATMHALWQVSWVFIWRHIVGKSQTKVPNVSMRHLGQALWKNTWQRTVETNHTYATNVIMHHLGQEIWRHLWVRFPRTGILAKMWSFFEKSRAFVWPNLVIFDWLFNCSCPSVSLAP